VEACIPKLGLIFARRWPQELLRATVRTVGIKLGRVDEVAAALLEQVVRDGGMEKETLWPDDVERIGQKVLEGQRKV
jgi:hypothetical protein